MRVVEWNAGGGGSAVGTMAAGWEIALSVEIDPDACRTLSVLHGHLVGPQDMRAWARGDHLGFPDDGLVWWASPPCQPFSPAGHNFGQADERNLWPELLTLVRRYRPVWLIAENVRGMLAPKHAEYTRWLLDQLGELFAHVELSLVDAADYGVPQYRRRVFIVCGPTPVRFPAPTHSAAQLEADKASGAYWSQRFDGTDPIRPPNASGAHAHRTMREALALGRDGLVLGGGSNPGRGRGANSARRSHPDLTDRPSTTIAAQRGGGAGNAGPWVSTKPEWWHRGSPADEPCRAIGTKRNASLTLGPGARRRLTPGECALLQDFDASHPFYGNATSVYRQVGNAVPPRLAEILMERVREAEEMRSR